MAKDTLANTDDRSAALVTGANIGVQNEKAFAEYAEARDKWLSTPIAHNTSLARGGYPFTIDEATERDFEATELDLTRGFEIGDLVPKIAYLCRSQMDWHHYPVGAEDVHYPKGEYFIILLNSNPIRLRDLARVQELLKEGPIVNICLQEYPNKTKGFNPAHGLVTANQWKSIL